MKTRTGGYPIGFRRGRSDWQSDIGDFANWAVANHLEVIDLRDDAADTAQPAVDAGLRIGSIDLPASRQMISADAGTRARAIATNVEHIARCAKFGQVNHFLVMMPEDPSLQRAENFNYMVESFTQLVPALEQHDSRIVIEGWPGPGALCCTPEGCRALFKGIPSPVMGLNYDPSRLIRMDIDHIRFLREFVDRVYHVHGKDTEVLVDEFYEFGREQPPTFAQPQPYSGMTWRYSIPGHGISRWTEIFKILETNGYQGCVSIELEDRNFYGSPEAEQTGILMGAMFLAGC
jgi:sugar phosphate isomerase/epimerase